MATGISAKLPLQYVKSDGPYLLTKDLVENTKQNFKNLIFTVPGERVMNSDFGVGLSALLFEQVTDDVIEDLKERLFVQTNKYLPFIQIVNFNTKFNENILNLKVEYLIPSLSVSDVLNLDIKGEIDL